MERNNIPKEIEGIMLFLKGILSLNWVHFSNIASEAEFLKYILKTMEKVYKWDTEREERAQKIKKEVKVLEDEIERARTPGQKYRLLRNYFKNLWEELEKGKKPSNRSN